jgi:butyrate kinase
VTERILVINPGARSTKAAVYECDVEALRGSITHTDADLAAYTGQPVLQQLPLRIAALEGWLSAHGRSGSEWSAVVARGGLLRPLESGAYRVTDAMLEDLRGAGRGQHAANLGAFLAREFALPAACPALVADPVSVDELAEVARVSGLAGLERESLSHALNTKAVARRHAATQGKRYEKLRLIVAHLGSGISVSAHVHGRMIDVNNSREEGPFSADRCGGLPVLALLDRAIREDWSPSDAERQVFREGGFYSYLGTRDLAVVIERAAMESEARRILDAMLYQIKKEVGAMAAVLDGHVDAVLLTGGMANAAAIAEPLAQQLSWVAPVSVYPGEDELRSLAEAAQRVLRGECELLAY